MNRTRRAFALAATIAALSPLGTAASISVSAEGTPMPALVHARPDGTPMPALVRLARPCMGLVAPHSRISPDDGTPIPACG